MTVPNIEIRKNTRELVRVNRADFKGRDVVNMRVFFDTGGGDMKPRKQGVAFRAALLPELLEALQSLVAEGVS
jgi:hypothetical protein